MSNKTKLNNMILMDNDADDIDIIKSITNKEDCHLYIINNLAEIIELVNLENIDIFLFDIELVDVNDFQFIKQLKENVSTKNIPIIFLVKELQSEKLINGLEAGGVDYIKKPLNELEVLIRVKTHLNIRHYHSELTTKNIDLEKLSKIKDEFIAIVSHDIKNPFNAILGLAQLLLIDRKEPLDNKKKGIVEMISSSAKGLLKYVDELLDIAALETGKIDIKRKNHNFRMVVQESYNRIAYNFMEKDIIFINEVKDNIFVNSDLTWTIELIINLLSNAIKFTKKDGYVSVRAFEKDNKYLHIKVEDNGIGIEAEAIPNLFDKHKKTSTKGIHGEKGTGFGLPLCKQIVELHNGKIWIESQQGKGTTVNFTLPIHKQKVIIVDDSILICENISEYIREGFEDINIVKFTDSEDGWNYIKENADFDLLILDLVIPKMDGFEMLNNINTFLGDLNDFPIIILTASENLEDKKKALRMKVKDYINKPVQKDEFIARVSRFI